MPVEWPQYISSCDCNFLALAHINICWKIISFTCSSFSLFSLFSPAYLYIVPFVSSLILYRPYFQSPYSFVPLSLSIMLKQFWASWLITQPVNVIYLYMRTTFSPRAGSADADFQVKVKFVFMYDEGKFRSPLKF